MLIFLLRIVTQDGLYLHVGVTMESNDPIRSLGT